jgi:hypothetical protein
MSFVEVGRITERGYTIAWGRNELGCPAVRVMVGETEVGWTYACYGDTVEGLGDLYNPENLYLDPKHRGKGLGCWMLIALSEAVKVMYGKYAYLVPADWYGRHLPEYVYGRYGTSLPALKNWERMGNHPL